MRETKRYRPSPLASSKWVEEWNRRTDTETRNAQDKFLWLLLILFINLCLVGIMFVLNY